MARVAISIAFGILALATAASAAEILGWAQCGGSSREIEPAGDAPWPDSACAAGYQCTRQTAFYWQCKPEAELFGQCGGTSTKNAALSGDRTWAGCPEASKCVRQSEFYWQCVTEGGEVTGATPPTTSSGSNMRVQAPKKPAAQQARPVKSLTPQTPKVAGKPVIMKP